MSKRLDPSWIVVESVENPQHDRCVDVFTRPDGSFGFEEFRRDVEDAGAWTPLSYFSGLRHVSKGEALAGSSAGVLVGPAKFLIYVTEAGRPLAPRRAVPLSSLRCRSGLDPNRPLINPPGVLRSGHSSATWEG